MLIKRAHRSNLFIYGATLLPYKNYRLYTDERNKVRKQVNDWIRSTKSKEGGFDDFFDFDLLMKDPQDNEKMIHSFNSGDGLHPNSLGYEKMANSINNLSLFSKIPDFNCNIKHNNLKIYKKEWIKYSLPYLVSEQKIIRIDVEGINEGDNGINVFTTDLTNEEKSNIYEINHLEKGHFRLKIILKAISKCSYLIFKSLNKEEKINKLLLSNLFLEIDETKMTYCPEEDAIISN